MVSPQPSVSYADRAKLAKLPSGKAKASNPPTMAKPSVNPTTSNPFNAVTAATENNSDAQNGRLTAHRVTDPTPGHPSKNADNSEASQTPPAGYSRSGMSIPPNTSGQRVPNVWTGRKEPSNSVRANAPATSRSIQSSPSHPPHPSLQPSSNPSTQPQTPVVANGPNLPNPPLPSGTPSSLPTSQNPDATRDLIPSQLPTPSAVATLPHAEPSKPKQKKKLAQQYHEPTVSSQPAHSTKLPAKTASAIPTKAISELSGSHQQHVTHAGLQPECTSSESSPKHPAVDTVQQQGGLDAHRDERPNPNSIADSSGKKVKSDIKPAIRGKSSFSKSNGGSQRSSVRNSPAQLGNVLLPLLSPTSQANAPHSAHSSRPRSPYFSPQPSHPHSPRVPSHAPSYQPSPRSSRYTPANLTPTLQAPSTLNYEANSTTPISLQPVPKKRSHRPSPSQSSPVTGNVTLPLTAQNDMFKHVFGTIAPEEPVDGPGLGLALGSDLIHVQTSHHVGSAQTGTWDIRPQTEAERILKETGKFGIGVANPQSVLPQEASTAPPPAVVAQNEELEQSDVRKWEFGSVDRMSPPILSPQPSVLIHPSHHLPLQLSEMSYNAEAPQSSVEPNFASFDRSPVTPNTGRYMDESRRGYGDGQGRFASNGNGYPGNGGSRRGGRGSNNRGGFSGRGGMGTNHRGGPAPGGSGYRGGPNVSGSYPPRLSRDGPYDNANSFGAPPVMDYLPSLDPYSQLPSPQVAHDPSQPSPYMTPTTPYGFWVVPPMLPVPGVPYIPPTYGPPYMTPAVAVPAFGQPVAMGPGYPPAPAPPIPMPITRPPFNLDSMRFYILGQVEYYFSTQNLSQDLFLRKQMDPEGWVDISVVASFNRMRKLTQDHDLVRETILLSSFLEVSGNKVRLANNAWHQFVLPPSTNVLLSPHQVDSAEGEAITPMDGAGGGTPSLVGGSRSHPTSVPEALVQGST